MWGKNIRGCAQLTGVSVRRLSLLSHQLYSLNLSGCLSLSTPSINLLFANLQELIDLDVTGLICVTDKSLRILSARSKKIKTLKLSCCRNVSGEGVMIIAERCKDLEGLWIGNIRGIGDDVMEKLGECKKLSILHVNDCLGMTDQSLLKFVQADDQLQFKNYSLEILNLCNNESITNSGIEKLAKGSPRLRSLMLSGCTQISDVALDHLVAYCPMMETLDLEECSITNLGLTIIANSNWTLCLKHLCLSYCDAITDTSVLYLLNRCQQLIELEVDNCSKLTDGLLDGIAASKYRIQNLEVFDCRGISDKAISRLEANGVRVRSFYTVQQRRTRYSDITDDDEMRIPMERPSRRCLIL